MAVQNQCFRRQRQTETACKLGGLQSSVKAIQGRLALAERLTCRNAARLDRANDAENVAIDRHVGRLASCLVGPAVVVECYQRYVATGHAASQIALIDSKPDGIEHLVAVVAVQFLEMAQSNRS